MTATVTTHLTRRERRDLKVLGLFTLVYCEAHHPGEKKALVPKDPFLAGLALEKRHLCADCREFLSYAIARRLHCPLDPKPNCKTCQIHCYRPDHRETVRKIMRFSGRRMIRQGRFDLLWRHIF